MGYFNRYQKDDLYQLHKDWTQEPKKLESMREILAFVPDDVRSVLDYGCGSGRYSQYFEKYIGFDRCTLWIEFAKKTYPNKDFVSILPKGKFDLVLVVSVIQYQPKDELVAFVKEVMDKSKKYVLIQTWDEDGPTKTVGSFRGSAYRRNKEIYLKILSKAGKVERHVLDKKENKVVFLLKREKSD